MSRLSTKSGDSMRRRRRRRCVISIRDSCALKKENISRRDPNKGKLELKLDAFKVSRN